MRKTVDNLLFDMRVSMDDELILYRYHDNIYY